MFHVHIHIYLDLSSIFINFIDGSGLLHSCISHLQYKHIVKTHRIGVGLHFCINGEGIQ